MSAHPTEERIHTWLEGRLAPAEASALEDHCARCPRCSTVRRELVAVMRALEIDAAARNLPPQPIWSALNARLGARSSSRPRLATALASCAAALAGLIIGFLVGSWTPEESVSESQTAVEAGSLVPGNAGMTLDEVYFQGISEEVATERGGEAL